MTASKFDGVALPGATEVPVVQPAVVARSQSPALLARFGLAALAVGSAGGGWVLFGDTNPALSTEGYWPVRELLPAVIGADR